MIFPKYEEGGRAVYLIQKPIYHQTKDRPHEGDSTEVKPSLLAAETPYSTTLDLHSHAQHQGRIETAEAQLLSHAADAFRG